MYMFGMYLISILISKKKHYMEDESYLELQK